MKTETTLRAIELAHKLLAENIVDQRGSLAYDEGFLKVLDELLKKFNETRELAEAMR